jgi:hypothetical protein
MPADAQPAPAPLATAEGRDVVVNESSGDDEMQQQGQSRSQFISLVALGPTAERSGTGVPQMD